MAVIEYTPERVAELIRETSIEAVREAVPIVREVLPVTPLMRHPLLVDALSVEVWVKHENHLPTGSFKVRGGLNYMAHLDEAARAKGVVTATRGNHGQSIAMAAQRLGVRCVVLVPHGNNPEKNAAMKAYGAELVEHGKDYDESREKVGDYTAEGLTFIHSSNEPLLIAGVGTYWLEIVDALPELDVAVVPIGGGSGACAAISVLRALKPEVRIIGVQAANAPCVYKSWKEGRLVSTDSANTIADGLATRVPFELPYEMLREGIDDIVLVTEEEILDSMRLLLSTTHNLAEGAGASAFAAIGKLRDEFQGKKVVGVMTGGNVDRATLKRVLDESSTD